MLLFILTLFLLIITPLHHFFDFVTTMDFFFILYYLIRDLDAGSYGDKVFDEAERGQENFHM